jgi:hypothetical protein
MRERWPLSIVGEGLRPSPHSGQAPPLACRKRINPQDMVVAAVAGAI